MSLGLLLVILLVIFLLGGFAQKRAGAVADDRRPAAGPIVLGDVDLPGQDDDQAVAHVADLASASPTP
jgi:hypothetical protein